MARTTEKPSTRKKQNQIRMDEALKTRIRKYQKQEGERIGFEVSFSAAVRKLIDMGLESARIVVSQ
jgi:hypothetical protein